MIPTDRFLDGLFAPHGGIYAPPAKLAPVSFTETFDRIVRGIAEMFNRPATQADYALQA